MPWLDRPVFHTRRIQGCRDHYSYWLIVLCSICSLALTPILLNSNNPSISLVGFFRLQAPIFHLAPCDILSTAQLAPSRLYYNKTLHVGGTSERAPRANSPHTPKNNGTRQASNMESDSRSAGPEDQGLRRAVSPHSDDLASRIRHQYLNNSPYR